MGHENGRAEADTEGGQVEGQGKTGWAREKVRARAMVVVASRVGQLVRMVVVGAMVHGGRGWWCVV